MPDLIIPPGYVQLAFKIQNSTVGHTCIWTCGGKLAGSGWSGAQQAELFLDVSNALRPMYDSNVHFLGFHGLIGNDGPPLAADVQADVTGTAGAMTTASPNVTYLMKKVTLFAGKAFRGRGYLPFVNSGELDEAGRISGTVLSRFQTACSELLDASLSVSGGGLNGWYLLHREGSAGAAEGPTLITNFSASNVVATQRRRLERD
jgi:hypothetical protein